MLSLSKHTEIATSNRQLAMMRLLVGVFCLQWGCAYRFTNKHVTKPEGINSIAVEAVYDTSREVLPHEHLWKALQDAFASDGHLRIAPQASADALVRAHIKQVAITPSGSVPPNREPDKDPDPFSGGEAPDPGDFRELSHQHPSKIRNYVSISVVVEIEVWSLRTRTLILKQSYPATDAFLANYYGQPSSSPANDHLRFEEAIESRVKSVSEQIARGVVRDLLVR